MARDAALVRVGKPFCFTNCRTGDGVDEVMQLMLEGVDVGAVRL